MQNEFEAEKLPRPQIAKRIAVYTVDQGTTNPAGAYPWGLAFLAGSITIVVLPFSASAL